MFYTFEKPQGNFVNRTLVKDCDALMRVGECAGFIEFDKLQVNGIEIFSYFG